MPAGTGGVGGEDRAGANSGQRLVEVEAGGGDQFADAFGTREAGVTLVHVEDLGGRADRGCA